jgi:hypothetical protein
MKKSKVLIGFLFFGIIIGLLTAWWSHISDGVFWLNFPGILYGDAVYEYSVKFFGPSSSAQLHYTTPWLFGVPQVYVLSSAVFWGVCGLLIQLAQNGYCKRYLSFSPRISKKI